MPDPTVDTTASGAPAPAAGEGGSQPAPSGTSEPGAQPGAPAAPPEGELTFNERERAFLAKAHDEVQKRQQLERELALLRANQPAYQPPPASAAAPGPAPAAPSNPFDELDDNELMTGADLKAKVVPYFQGMVQQIAGALMVQQRQSQFSDVTVEDIRTIVPKLVQEDPALAQVINVLPGPAQFIVAQTLARLAKRAAGPAGPTPPPNPAGNPNPLTPPDPLVDLARTILANAKKPGAPGAAGGGAMDDLLSIVKNLVPGSAEETAWREAKKKAMGL